MASTRMMTKASDDYRQAVEANDTEQAAKIGQWLESAQLGYSDRDCAFHSGYEPAPRRLRRSTRQLAEVAV